MPRRKRKIFTLTVDGKPLLSEKACIKTISKVKRDNPLYSLQTMSTKLDIHKEEGPSFFVGFVVWNGDSFYEENHPIGLVCNPKCIYRSKCFPGKTDRRWTAIECLPESIKLLLEL